jgi:hypothetical protein
MIFFNNIRAPDLPPENQPFHSGIGTTKVSHFLS